MHDLAAILEQHGVEVRRGGQHKHVRSGWVGIDCPRCGAGSGKFHLGINEAAGFAVCWRCGYVRADRVLSEVTGEPLSVVSGWLKYRTRNARMAQERSRPPGRLKIPTGLNGPLKQPHRAYLERRGLNPEVLMQLWGIGGSGPDCRLPWRLFIPIHLDGRIVSWTTRAIGSSNARYLTAKPDEESVPHKSLLYGEDYARHAVVVVEGPLDVWRIGPGAVATFGLSYTQSQLRKIERYPVRCICFDSEPEAQRIACRLVDQLAASPGETYRVELQSGKDAAEADEEEIELLRKFLS